MTTRRLALDWWLAPARYLLAMTLISTLLAGCAVAPPSGFVQPQAPDRFTPCPDSPNCVSSQAVAESSRHVPPLVHDTSAAQARAILLEVLHGFGNAEVVTDEDNFIHAVFRTTVGFVDDVTFIIHPQEAFIDVKSASRVGYYDFGVNRRRVERLRKRFNNRLAAAGRESAG